MEAVGRLAGGVAHDFNNLLTIINGYSDMALAGFGEADPARSLIEEVRKAGERAVGLTRQMLAYSGKGRFVIERLNLEQQVQQIVSLIMASIPKGVKVELDFEPGLPPIEGDSGQLQQLIMNLVINGAEAIGERPGIVTVTTGVQQLDEHSAAAMRSTQECSPYG